jgi:hypothetical protein
MVQIWLMPESSAGALEPCRARGRIGRRRERLEQVRLKSRPRGVETAARPADDRVEDDVMRETPAPTAAALALLAGLLACTPARREPEQRIFSDPLDSIGSVLTKSGLDVDPTVSRDGRGSIRVSAAGATTVRIAELHPEAAENATLFYRAALRAEDLEGRAYLEMWAGIPGRGEFFSRALQDPLTGTSDWITQETPFFLEEGQRAETVKLNLVVDGRGTVWIDDVELALAPH